MSAILTPPIQRILAMTPRVGRGKQAPQIQVLPVRVIQRVPFWNSWRNAMTGKAGFSVNRRGYFIEVKYGRYACMTESILKKHEDSKHDRTLVNPAPSLRGQTNDLF